MNERMNNKMMTASLFYWLRGPFIKLVKRRNTIEIWHLLMGHQQCNLTRLGVEQTNNHNRNCCNCSAAPTHPPYSPLKSACCCDGCNTACCCCCCCCCNLQSVNRFRYRPTVSLAVLLLLLLLLCLVALFD